MSDNLMPTECPFCGAVVVAKTHGGFYPYWEHIDFKCGTHWTANVGFRRECTPQLHLETPAPTKRQQVAERVLMAIIAHYGSPDEHENHIERVYLNVAQWLRQCARFISALGLALCKTLGIPELIIILESMAAVLEEAAREEQE